MRSTPAALSAANCEATTENRGSLARLRSRRKLDRQFPACVHSGDRLSQFLHAAIAREGPGIMRGLSRVGGRGFVGAVGAMLVLCGITAGLAGGAIALPVLWTAGGLDAGSTGAGQAGADWPPTPRAMLRWCQGLPAAVISRSRPTRPAGPCGGGGGQPGPGNVPRAIGWRQRPTGISSRSVTTSTLEGRPIASTLVRYASDGTLRWRVDSWPWWRG